MSDRDIALLSAWVDGGTPEGDRQDAPPPKKFTDGWTLGTPDLILEPRGSVEAEPSLGCGSVTSVGDSRRSGRLGLCTALPALPVMGPCPQLDAEAAYEQLAEEIVHVCRLDEPDPAAAWQARIGELSAVGERLNALGLDALHYEGPGTDLTVGLLPSSSWIGALSTTVDGLEHLPNVPTEEVFTTPDPERADGHVRSTMPLVLVDGSIVRGLEARFEGGRAVHIDAEEGAELIRARTARDEGASRLGEVALVDRESRIGQLGTVFYETLLDENAASHIALGSGFSFGVQTDEDRARVNESAIHIDFMIGGNDVDVTGLTADGERVPLLRDGVWQPTAVTTA